MDILPPSGGVSYACPVRARFGAGSAALALVIGLSGTVGAQTPATVSDTGPKTIGVAGTTARRDSIAPHRQPVLSPRYWQYFALGFATSLAMHEGAHVMTSVALGAKPSFGFNDGRPTIYSGIVGDVQHHKQFLFSAAGLVTQNVVDELILDVPHARGSAFERGILGGGLGTTIFYLTIGRAGTVSDVEVMAAMHGMTKTQSTLLFGSIATVHMIRISRDDHYANFFARPSLDGGVDMGLELKTK